ncbi:hypothetical protein GCM10009424_25300 [Sphingomonas ursincola]|uniref:Uncharacterized protein n=1 Tax=Sphingomonas ursincola TaxID=56361 RepID=A0A7V8RC48_9SPHN|nr:hypothetical protein [Sphingomonas ursincola]MBA1373729.1 hypothetical protein [Sphingomonas ursincola]MBY0620046.1 hypothetical protein [Sphingomonas ursincola]
MIDAFNLAGFLSAHAIWCIEDGEVLIPIFGYMMANGERRLERIELENHEVSVALGKRNLEANQYGAINAVLLYDGRVQLGAEKIDAIIVEIRSYSQLYPEAVLFIPYRSKSSSVKFLVYRPKLVHWKNWDDLDLEAALESFFEGVDAHEHGAAVWNASLDQSL